MIRLLNVEKRNKRNPDTFPIPELEDRTSLTPGDFAKLHFMMGNGQSENERPGERMWVEVISRRNDTYMGVLSNDPTVLDLEYGDLISFTAKHVADIMSAQERAKLGIVKSSPIDLVCLNCNRPSYLRPKKT
jgi:hypothetical protein